MAVVSLGVLRFGSLSSGSLGLALVSYGEFRYGVLRQAVQWFAEVRLGLVGYWKTFAPGSGSMPDSR